MCAYTTYHRSHNRIYHPILIAQFFHCKMKWISDKKLIAPFLFGISFAISCIPTAVLLYLTFKKVNFIFCKFFYTIFIIINLSFFLSLLICEI